MSIVYWQLTYLQLKELHLDDKNSILLLCDNIRNIKLVCNPIMHQQTKHIELYYYYIKNKY
uniref:Uncharacterized protein n=2 Tax=Physcomitrium patens TaxID=3218 RepID=A0A2K1JLE6_PHYPA|nr:hypothetical protein PHYPA_017168 [Physcomitrium patens]